MLYWDTSSVLKLYVKESDSGLLLTLMAASKEPLCSSDLLRTEMYYALHKKEHSGDIKRHSADRIFAQFLKDIEIGRFVLLPFGGDVERHARAIVKKCYEHGEPVPLRALDGIHLGSALAGKFREVVTNDHRMRAAAPLIGLKVLPTSV